MSLHTVSFALRLKPNAVPFGHDGIVNEATVNKLQYAKEHG
jgi:hypothetical protein